MMQKIFEIIISAIIFFHLTRFQVFGWTTVSISRLDRKIIVPVSVRLTQGPMEEDEITQPKRQVFRRNSRGRRARIVRAVSEAAAPSPSVARLVTQPLTLSIHEPLTPLVQTVVRAIDMRKADNIVVFKVSKITSLTEFIIVCSGNSRPQNQAIAAAVQSDVKDSFDDTYKLRGNGCAEGSADSGWIILDYGDIMVHVMTPKSRLFFDIEGKWKLKGAEGVDISPWLTKQSPFAPTSSNLSGTAVSDSLGYTSRVEEDPFWS